MYPYYRWFLVQFPGSVFRKSSHQLFSVSTFLYDLDILLSNTRTEETGKENFAEKAYVHRSFKQNDECGEIKKFRCKF